MLPDAHQPPSLPSNSHFKSHLHLPLVITQTITSIINIMFILIFLTLISPAAASYPACGRRARIDPTNPTTAHFLLEPAIQMDYAHCAGLCGLAAECGGYASTAKKQVSDWCFVFRKGL